MKQFRRALVADTAAMFFAVFECADLEPPAAADRSFDRIRRIEKAIFKLVRVTVEFALIYDFPQGSAGAFEIMLDLAEVFLGNGHALVSMSCVMCEGNGGPDET